jgi:tetratricopeptide (TPR) repeat protein
MFLVASFSIGQTESERQYLDDLDSLAFSALEKGESNIEEKAKDLLESSQKYGSSIHEINAYTLLGIVNKNKGYYVSAVEFYQKALHVAEENGDLGRASACFNNIGSVYQIQKNYPKALAFFKKSLSMEEQLDKPLQKSIRLYNIGDMYREMDSLTLALSNFNSSLLIEQQYQNNIGIVYALLGISDVYLKLNKLLDASISLNEAKKYLRESDIEVRVTYHMLKSDLLLKENKPQRALSELMIAKNISKDKGFKVRLPDIYEKEIAIKDVQESLATNSSKKGGRKDTTMMNLWISLMSILVVLIGVVLFIRKRRSKKGKSQESSTQKAEQPFKLVSNSGKVLLEISFSSIVCFEANDNYVITHYLLNDEIQKSMERVSLKKIESIIGEGETSFFRVHKSYIINKVHLQKIEGKSQAYKIRMAHIEKPIPVSRSFDMQTMYG